MHEDDELREVARAARPYLEELIGDAAPEVDGQLAKLLAEKGNVREQLGEVLWSSPALQEFTEATLRDERLRPPPVQALAQGYGTGGQGEPVEAERYVCPTPPPHYVWYRISVTVPVRQCPAHHVLLVPG
ncbi:hypothetical protein ABZ502_17350 [Streptomyces abikoensis]|uniref:hypothetical protein n=1 Tax=Streptomyces abikoensis TaxID=97398 RepID=UPI0033DCEC73